MPDLSTLSTYMNVEEAMLGVVQEEFHEDVFFQTLQQGRYALPQIRHFAIQYSYYSRHFPRVLGAAISAMAPLDTWWVPLADNLWDEAGRGVNGKSHERLYKCVSEKGSSKIRVVQGSQPKMRTERTFSGT